MRDEKYPWGLFLMATITSVFGVIIDVDVIFAIGLLELFLTEFYLNLSDSL